MQKLLAILCPVFMLFSIYLGYELYVVRDPVITTPSLKQCNSFKSDYTNSPWTGRIDARLAYAMADSFKNDRTKSLISVGNKMTGDSDTRSVWYPLESLKSYIWAIENQRCLNGCSDSLGLRIYFAKYPTDTSKLWSWPGLGDVNHVYASHHTLFMIPTYYDANAKANIDFDPWAVGGGCHNPLAIPGIIEHTWDAGNSVISKYVFYDLIVNDNEKNHGNLIPPNDPTGTSF